MKEFLKTTIVGGLVFLLPVALVAAIMNHALQLAVKMIKPIRASFPMDEFGKIAGIGIETALAILLLICISFAAGILARTGGGLRVSRWFESSFLGGLPQYEMMKSMAAGLAQIEGGSSDLKPALVNVGDGWEIGYLLERLDNGWVAVFSPQAPTPMSGKVKYLSSDRVRLLDITMLQATAIVKHIGVGSGTVLRGIDLGKAAPPGTLSSERA